MQKPNTPVDGQAGDIEVTPEMVEAGADLLMDRMSESMGFPCAKSLARELFCTMFDIGEGSNKRRD